MRLQTGRAILSQPGRVSAGRGLLEHLYPVQTRPRSRSTTRRLPPLIPRCGFSATSGPARGALIEVSVLKTGRLVATDRPAVGPPTPGCERYAAAGQRGEGGRMRPPPITAPGLLRALIISRRYPYLRRGTFRRQGRLGATIDSRQ
jgi:hypothetical protein